MRVLARMRHPSIVSVVGAIFEKDFPPLLVMEVCEVGSLKHLVQNKTVVLEPHTFLPILKDIVQVRVVDTFFLLLFRLVSILKDIMRVRIVAIILQFILSPRFCPFLRKISEIGHNPLILWPQTPPPSASLNLSERVSDSTEF